MGALAGLHVLIVPSWWPTPEQPLRGVFFPDYARAFARAGARVGVIFPDLVSVRFARASAAAPLRPRVECDDCDGLPVVRVRGLHTSLGLPALQMRRYGRWLARGFEAYCRARGTPDVLHAMCAIPAGWAAMRLAGRLRTPLVITEHTGPFSLVMRPGAGRRFVRRALAGAHAVVAVARILRRDMHAAGIARDIEVIPNPVPDEFAPAAPPALQKDSRARPIFRAAFVGHLCPAKGIGELIEAAAHLKDDPPFAIEWHVVGDGPMRDEARRRFEAMGPAATSRFHGACDRRRVPDVLRQSHFFVLPSHGENCPVALCEALCVGRPVVATRGTGCEELVTAENGVLAGVGDAADLGRAIRALVSDYGRFDWTAISAQARRRFGAEPIAARYAEIFRRALRDPAPTPPA